MYLNFKNLEIWDVPLVSLKRKKIYVKKMLKMSKPSKNCFVLRYFTGFLSIVQSESVGVTICLQ